MLKLEFKDDYDNSLPFSDIEEIFSTTQVQDNQVVRKAIHEIDEGEYLDNFRFKDRFGEVLPIHFLSTGCKAAIILALGYSERLDVTECGTNAIDFILKNCTNGNIVVNEPYPITWTTEDSSDDSCDVGFNGYRFSSLARLNYYINDEWGYGDSDRPYFGMPGVERIVD